MVKIKDGHTREKLMSKKTFFFVTGFCIVFIVGAIMTNYLSVQNEMIVKQEDVELNILDIEQLDDNNYYITAEVINNSSFDLEDNHIFIDEAYNSSDGNNQPTSSSTNENSSTVTEYADEEQEPNIDIEIDEQNGTFNQVLANNSVQIGVNFEFLKENDDKTVLLIFRSDIIRNSNNATKKFYTTLTETVSINEMN